MASPISYSTIVIDSVTAIHSSKSKSLTAKYPNCRSSSPISRSSPPNKFPRITSKAFYSVSTESKVSGDGEVVHEPWVYRPPCHFSPQTVKDIETEERNRTAYKSSKSKIFLQWDNRKCLRCMRFKDPQISARLNGRFQRKLTSLLDPSVTNIFEEENNNLQLNRLRKNFDEVLDRMELKMWTVELYGDAVVADAGKCCQFLLELPEFVKLVAATRSGK